VAVGSSMACLPAGVRGGVAAWGALAGFRAGWYGCLGRWADTLFELTDAVLCAGGPVRSLPRLSLEPVCRRGHGSGYAALAKGDVAAGALADLLAACRPRSWPAVFAVDATTWPRAAAACSPGRGLWHHPSRHMRGRPVVAGWCYQLVSQLNFDRDSWTWPLDARRIGRREDAAVATVAQAGGVLARLGDTGGQVPLFVFDAGSSYDPAWLTHELAGPRAQVLVRLRKNRVFFADPPPRGPHTSGAPARHGAPFALKDPRTWPAPDALFTTSDPVYGTVTVRAWARLHPRLRRTGRWASHARAPIVAGWVLRAEVTRLPTPAPTHPAALWLWWAGPAQMTPDLHLCWRAYTHRFDIEHAIRLEKTTLGWVTPALRHPEQADRWTAIILAACAQLTLARPLAADHRLPWEKPRDPHLLTPGRVRRDFPRIRASLPPVTNPRKPFGTGPGRPAGRPTHRAKRYPVIKKTASTTGPG
jgi:hypothetical protein